MADDTRNILEGRRGYSCRAAAEAFGIVLRSGVENDRPQDPDPRVVHWQRFIDWCTKAGRNLGVLENDAERGGNEHVSIIETDDFYYKATFPSRAGYHVTIEPDDGIEFNNSLPLDYLERQALQAELFGVPCELLGVMGASDRFQLVVAQRRVIGHPFGSGFVFAWTL